MGVSKLSVRRRGDRQAGGGRSQPTNEDGDEPNKDESPTRMRAQTSRNMHLIDAQDELARTDSGDNEMAFKLKHRARRVHRTRSSLAPRQ